MRHHRANRKFGRVRKIRKALLRSLAESLVLKEKIRTTEMKAKEIRPLVEKLVSLGKTKSIASERLLVSRVGKLSAHKLINTLGPRYAERKGGFLRITKLGRSKSSAIPMAVIEFV